MTEATAFARCTGASANESTLARKRFCALRSHGAALSSLTGFTNGARASRTTALLLPCDAAAMHVRPASTRLNAAKYDAPDVLIDDDPVQEQLF
jgi:hypothetical protein